MKLSTAQNLIADVIINAKYGMGFGKDIPYENKQLMFLYIKNSKINNLPLKNFKHTHTEKILSILYPTCFGI